MARIAFDLDETLATPIIGEDGAVASFQWRGGAHALLEELSRDHELVLWSVSPRVYVNKALEAGLSAYMSASYSWDEVPCSFKDIRKIGADWLVDDSAEYKQQAEASGIGGRYIQVPAIGSPEDRIEPSAWLFLVRQALGLPLGKELQARFADPHAVLCRLMGFAFAELRAMSGPGVDHERVHDLAHAFHNAPAQLSSGLFEWDKLRAALLLYQRDYESLFDYVFVIELFLSASERGACEETT